MKTNQDGRYLIDSYVEKVGSQLPMRQRGDIQTEIRSLLEDTLEDRLNASGGEADVEMVAGLLEEFGPPDKMAASYSPDRYLIGPKLFPLFALVTKIVFTVLIVLGIIGAGIAVAPAETFNDALLSIGSSLLELFSGLMSTFASLVITFAILERVLPGKNRDDEDWDPRKMERVPDQDKVKVGELIAGIVFSTIGIVIFNFFPNIFRGIVSADGAIHTFQILGANFMRFIPWLTAIWALEILFSIILLWRRQWEPAVRWIRIGLDVLGMALTVAMLFGGPLVATSPEAIAAWPSEDLIPLAQTGIKAVLGIVLVLEGVSVIEQLIKQFKIKPVTYVEI